MFYILIYVLFCITTSTFFISIFFNMLHGYKLYSYNFDNMKVINIMGISFVPILLCLYMYLAWFIEMNVENSIPLIIGICSMGFVGIVDDLVGNRRTTGLRGHFSKFIKGDFTTGTFKAIICLLISIIISSTLSKGYIDLILNILVICLSTNLINIFDVRPGRAVKVVLFLCTIFLLIEISLLYLATPLICMLGVYGNYDVKSYCMMGDTGSNILGFILGFFSISHFDFLTKITYLIFLIIIHIVAERYSITDIINHHRVLSFIDKIGSIRQN